LRCESQSFHPRCFSSPDIENARQKGCAVTVKYHYDLIQCTEPWYAARCGLLTASEMSKIITAKTLKYSESKDTNTHLYELLAQRITSYVEPHFISHDMQRGKDDEIDAKVLYEKHFFPVKDCGFITNDKWGFTLGYSPDGLVGDDGQIEVKSRAQKYQMQTILEWGMPPDFVIQLQTGLLVSERPWCDFISFCGGMPMFPLRIEADDDVQTAIIAAATIFHQKLDEKMAIYMEKKNHPALIPTVRRPPDDEIRGSAA
jgi:hypothetical protein